MQPAAVVLRAGSPDASVWLPQLQRCTILVFSDAQLRALGQGLDAPGAQQMRQLHSLTLHDRRPLAARLASPPALPALAHLPELRKLVRRGWAARGCAVCLVLRLGCYALPGHVVESLMHMLPSALPTTPFTPPCARQACHGSAPEAAWSCPHLTSLLVDGAPHISTAGTEDAQCTSLRQLQLEGCTLESGTFPRSLCSALRQLSSLAAVRSGLEGLPCEFSLLRWPEGQNWLPDGSHRSQCVGEGCSKAGPTVQFCAASAQIPRD